MPWNVRNKMSLKKEFVCVAKQNKIQFGKLCERFNISRPTGYKWLNNYQQNGDAGLEEKSRKALNSPSRTNREIEQFIVQERLKHPVWGGRKLHRVLINQGRTEVPHPSTINGILRRNHLIAETSSAQHTKFKRFEHAAPNDLWQMDFKGHFPLRGHQRCHPLTIIDDHSRFSVGLEACARENFSTVQSALTNAFRRYGLPARMTMDNGAPWGNPLHAGRTSTFDIWLMRLGIRVSHSRPRHPQTQGKDERFNKTLKVELLNLTSFSSLTETQLAFDRWRIQYNHERPHEAIQMQTPDQRYAPSLREFKERLDPIEYLPDDIVRKVDCDGYISYAGKLFKAGTVFKGNFVAIRPTKKDGEFNIFFCQQIIKTIHLNQQ